MTHIEFEPDPAPEDVQTVRDGLATYNVAQCGDPAAFTPITLLVRDDAGSVVGGLLGGTYWGWLVVEILWLDESLRGQGLGSRLLAQAEQIAVERGCHAAHLDTMSFQAEGFYARHGYRVFGVLDDLPPGHKRVFMQKRIGKIAGE